jgi:hypothetical protein
VAIVVLAAPGLALTQTPALNNTASIKVGDMAALLLSDMLGLRQDFSDPTAVSFAPEPGIIVVEIYGNSGNAERAKQLVSQHWEFIKAAHVPYIQRRFSVQLNENSFQIAYYQRTMSGEPKLILRFVGGQYVLGP